MDLGIEYYVPSDNLYSLVGDSLGTWDDTNKINNHKWFLDLTPFTTSMKHQSMKSTAPEVTQFPSKYYPDPILKYWNTSVKDL